MKKLFLLLFIGLISTSFTVYAAATIEPFSSTYELQDADNGDITRVSINSLGNFGVGTASPEARLHVDAGAPANAVDVLIGSGSTASGGNTYFSMGRSSATNGVGQIDSWISGGGNNNLALQSKFGGNVGVGTASPLERLDVNGNIRLSGNIISPNDICIGTCS